MCSCIGECDVNVTPPDPNDFWTYIGLLAAIVVCALMIIFHP